MLTSTISEANQILSPRSQTGNQRRQTPGDVRRGPATINAVSCHNRRRQRTCCDGRVASYKRGVTGSNPVAPTRSEGVWGSRPRSAGSQTGAPALMADASVGRRRHTGSAFAGRSWGRPSRRFGTSSGLCTRSSTLGCRRRRVHGPGGGGGLAGARAGPVRRPAGGRHTAGAGRHHRPGLPAPGRARRRIQDRGAHLGRVVRRGRAARCGYDHQPPGHVPVRTHQDTAGGLDLPQ